MNTIQGNTLKDVWLEARDGFGFTNKGWNLRLRLDYIPYSKEFELCDVKVVDSDVSDHRALVADFVMLNYDIIIPNMITI